MQPMLFGKYCLLERISVGGMAEVFRAKPFDISGFDGYLALKRILPHLAEDDEFIAMFVDEAALTVNLHHPNVIRTYELGQFQNSYYILMEYISGRDLLALQKQMRRTQQIIPPHAAAFIAREMAKGLAYAHAKADENGHPLNIIHRDVSPQNVIISYNGGVKIIDFGIAKAAVQSTKTQVGVLKGKMGYMSPEQVRGHDIDSRSDIFAIGTVLWEMLTNQRLFNGANEFETMRLLQNPNIQAPSTLNPSVPPELENIVGGLLAAETQNRYQSGDQVAAALDQWLVGTGYTDHHFAEWFQGVFQPELDEERRKHAEFVTIRTADDVRNRFQAAYVADSGQPSNVWAAEVAPEASADAMEFANEHTTVQAGGFDPNAYDSDTDQLKLLTAKTDEHANDAVEQQRNESQPQRASFDGSGTDVKPAPKKQSPLLFFFIAIPGVLALVGLGIAYIMLSGPTTGIVEVAGSGSGELKLNGVVVAKALPASIPDVPFGPQKLSFSRSGTPPLSTSFSVDSLSTVVTFKTPVPTETTYTLTIDAPKKATVFVDGELVDSVVELAQGEHWVESFSDNRKPWRKLVKMNQDERVEVEHVRLEKKISIRSKLKKFKLDGKRVSSPHSVKMAPNDVRLAVFGKSESSIALPLTLSNRVVLDEIAPLKADELGALVFVTEPNWEIVVDGEETGLVTPISYKNKLPIRPGKYKLGLKRRGQLFEFEAVVKPGQTFALKKELSEE